MAAALAATHGIGTKEAFELLRGHARRNGVKLHDAAARVIDGTLRL